MPRTKIFTWKIDKLIYDIEGLLLNCKWLRNRIYIPYLGLTDRDKLRFKKELINLISKEILGKDFMLALAKDIIKHDKEKNIIYVDVESNVYKYMAEIYKGNVRKLVIELRSILAKEKDNGE